MNAIEMAIGDEETVAEQMQRSVIPLLSIWRRPRKAMRQLVERGSLLPAFLFAIASGIVNAFDFVQTSEIDDSITDETTKLLVTIGGGIVSGIIFLIFLSVLFMYFGRWLGGKGSFRQVSTVVGWAMLPFVGSLIVVVIEFALYGSSAYLAGGELLSEAQAAHSVADFILLLANLVFAVYAIIFLIAGLTEAHRLTLMQGAGTFFIFAILYIVFWIAVQALFAGM